MVNASIYYEIISFVHGVFQLRDIELVGHTGRVWEITNAHNIITRTSRSFRVFPYFVQAECKEIQQEVVGWIHVTCDRVQ